MKNACLLLILSTIFACTGEKDQPKEGLVDDVYTEVPLHAIRPEGWLRHQLEIMRDGSTGRLDEIHPKLSNDNGWLGGEGDGWEETPYWLDGAVPLAWLLQDSALQRKVMQYVNWTLDNQRPSGYFGPITKAERTQGVEITADNCDAGEDWWPRMIMLKVLKQYYSATQDERVIPFMTNYFTYQLNALDSCRIGKWTEWAEARGADNVMITQWLYRITGDEKLLTLAEKISEQSYPWSEWLGNRDWVMEAAAQQNHDDWMHRHAVNIGMGLKAPAVQYRRTGNESYLQSLETGWNDLMLLHGLPMGIFSGDEDLHGNAPTQGIELCSITESMFSLEKIIAVTGDVRYMDALERMTFNALPTQTTDDYNMKQYFQIANQVQVSRGVFDFSLPFNRGMNNVFGLRSGYTCCTTNMHQGWTKFASHLWFFTNDDGIAALEYAPSRVSVDLNGSEVSVREVTDYPFSDVINFEISANEAVAFPLHLRIPSWCSEATITINGQEHSREPGGQVVAINRTWNDGDRVSLHLPMEVTTSNWGKNSRTVERGPLVYALKLGERWEKGNEPTEGDYYSIYPTEEWNYGLTEAVVKDPKGNSKIETKDISDAFIWNIDHAPIEIHVPAKKIPGWQAVNGVAYQPITDRNGIYKGEVDRKTDTVTLIPYGCTKVRVVAFPVVP